MQGKLIGAEIEENHENGASYAYHGVILTLTLGEHVQLFSFLAAFVAMATRG